MHFQNLGQVKISMPKAKSHLYVPANNQRLIASAGKLRPGSLILDLEDGVSENQKQSALDDLQNTILSVGHDDTWVRINSGERGVIEAVALSSMTGVKGIWVAKAEPSEHFRQIVELAEARGLEVGVLIESAIGYLSRHELLAPKLVSRVQIGEYDLRGEIGMAQAGPNSDADLRGVRLEIVISAVSKGVSELVAGVSSNLADLEIFERSCRSMADLGFTGRACIHPSQVKISDSVFPPTTEEVTWATQVLAEFESQTASGNGAYRDANGQMADAATVRRARHIMTLAN
jgi:citrate lyase subunit beta/citryl-CoA lyase